MELIQAKEIADELCKELEPYCLRVQVAGSVRRERPTVNDIDIVVIPKGFEEKERIKNTCMEKHPAFGFADKPKSGEALERFFHEKYQIWIDVYYATSSSFHLILLIRTGSKEHNIFLCKTAKDKGMWLAADGSGLYADREKSRNLDVKGEAGVFAALGLPYKAAKSREIEVSGAGGNEG
jgi:DNA polymerase/3'-5' exonuclease PolX